jgi:predicted nucleic acid-binding protein
MNPTVYIETTIVSYLTARQSKDIVRSSHELLTHAWWTRSRRHFDLYTSVFTINEASAGDPAAAAERLRALQEIPMLPITSDVAVLAAQLEQALSLPPRARADAPHLAVAAVNRMDFLLTWNCTHLANGMLTARIEKACGAAGFVSPRILTPELLMELP